MTRLTPHIILLLSQVEALDPSLTSVGLAGVTWSHLVLLIFRHKDDDRQFALYPPLGKVQWYKSFDNQPSLAWHRPDYRDNVQYGKLDWD